MHVRRCCKKIVLLRIKNEIFQYDSCTECVKTFGLVSIMEIGGRQGLNVQKKGIVKQPDPVRPPPNNTEEGK